MALMKRANREIKVPENLVEEYLHKGYSLIDEKGTIIKESKPNTVGDYRELVASMRSKMEAFEEEKKTLIEERDSLKARFAELEAELAKKTKTAKDA